MIPRTNRPVSELLHAGPTAVAATKKAIDCHITIPFVSPFGEARGLVMPPSLLALGDKVIDKTHGRSSRCIQFPVYKGRYACDGVADRRIVLRTDEQCHRPPRAVRTPRSLSAFAI